MSDASKRESLLPIIDKLTEVVENLACLCKYQQNLLSQYKSIEDEENKLKRILMGDDAMM